MIRYYLTYSHGSGFGATEVRRNTPLLTWDDLTTVRRDLADTTGLPMTQLVILSFTEWPES